MQLEKVLQPCEVADACEPYLKEDRNKERLMQTAQQYCERLGAFRMPLGWIAIDLSRILSGSHQPDKTEALSAMTASTVAGILAFVGSPKNDSSNSGGLQPRSGIFFFNYGVSRLDLSQTLHTILVPVNDH